MSLRCMSWVFTESAVDGFNRLVLLAIADEADDDGAGAYPSWQRIAEKAHASKRTVQRCIESLEADGELLVERPEEKGRGHVWSYTVLMGREAGQVTEGRGERLFPVPRPNRPKKTVTKGAERRTVLPNSRQTQDPVTTTPPTPPEVTSAIDLLARRELDIERQKGNPINSEDRWLTSKRRKLWRHRTRMTKDLERDPTLTPDRLIALVLNAPYRRAWESDLEREAESA